MGMWGLLFPCAREGSFTATCGWLYVQGYGGRTLLKGITCLHWAFQRSSWGTLEEAFSRQHELSLHVVIMPGERCRVVKVDGGECDAKLPLCHDQGGGGICTCLGEG